MAMTKSPHNVFLPADDVWLDLHDIPSYFFLRIHVPTGHVYLDHFNSSHGVSPMDLEQQVPSKVEALRLEERVAKWNKQAPGTWEYETCSLGDVHDILRCAKAKHVAASQAKALPMADES